MTVELIYERDCPNVPNARANLLTALAAAGRETRWTEWDRGAADSPAHVRYYGSPTILVDGNDVAGGSTAGILQSGVSPSCRLYRNAEGQLVGVPSVDDIMAAISQQAGAGDHAGRGRTDWKVSLVTAPGVAFALMPSIACPACWPAYAGLMSMFGLGFLLDGSWLLPVTTAFLAIADGALAFRSKARRGYPPFVLGVARSMVLLASKFFVDSNAGMYSGIAMLVAASIWNAWPLSGNRATCQNCVSVSALQKETS